MNLFDRAVVGLLPLVPKPMVRRFSDPYIAGETLADAVTRIRGLNSGGMMATLDILGENITRLEEAEVHRREYLEALDRISETSIDANVSVKLSQLGLVLDSEVCYQNIRAIVIRASERNNTVRIDMEDSSCTTRTLDIFQRLRAEFGNVGIVLQSMLRRSLADLRAMADAKPSVRICKGIYVEPWKLAYKDGDLVNRSFLLMLEELIDAGGYPAIATHDERLVFESMRLLERKGLAREGYEFQMLLGVREELRTLIVEAGHRLRVYVPFGEQWYAYSVRRMRENPRVAGLVARSVLGLNESGR